VRIGSWGTAIMQRSRRTSSALPWLSASVALSVAIVLGLISNEPLIAVSILAVCILLLVLVKWQFGAYLLALLLPIENFVTAGPLVSGVKVVMLVTLFSILLRAIIQRSGLRRLGWFCVQPMTVAAFVLTAWSFVSTLWAQRSDVALSKSFTYLGLVGLMYVISELDSQALSMFWKVLSVSAVISVVVSIVLLQQSSDRLSSAGADPNDYANLLVLILCVVYFGRVRLRLHSAYMLTLLAGILLTQSRGGLVTLVATLLIGVYLARKQGKRRVLGTVYAMLLAGLAFATLSMLNPSTQQDLVKRYGSLTQLGDENSWAGRLDIWRAAGKMIPQAPLIGVGSGNFPYECGRYSLTCVQMNNLREGSAVAHNAFLAITSEVGLVGLVMFLGLQFSALRRASALANQGVPLAQGLVYGLIAYVIAGQVLSWEYVKIPFVLYGSVLALSHSSDPTRRSHQQHEAESAAHLT
jgi:O-antigen ligase